MTAIFANRVLTGPQLQPLQDACVLVEGETIAKIMTRQEFLTAGLAGCEVVELHLLPAYRGHGIGSHILRRLQEACMAQKLKLRIGCFKDNHRAKQLYERLGFIQMDETDNHYILEAVAPLPNNDPNELQR